MLTIGQVSVVAVVVEVEEVEEIAKRRAIERHVRIIIVDSRIREIVAAAMRQWFQIPIAFDELQD